MEKRMEGLIVDLLRIMETRSLALLAGAGLDLLLGDPQGLWHPVRGIGALIAQLERMLRNTFPVTARGQKLAGCFLVALVLVFTASGTMALLLAGYVLHPMAGIIVEIYLCYSMLAARSLHVESRRVQRALELEGLGAGRRAVAMIVGRDTQQLTEEGVVKAAVETIAENTSDGVIAPMLYFALLGPIGGWCYKAVNTMDSMLGYKNERYLYFGRAAARLDDVANYIPARLSACFMLLASLMPGFDAGNALRIYLRDRKKHASPNSAQTEAVMAGALKVALAGDASYFGKKVAKPVIGDPIRQITCEDIGRAAVLMYGTALIGMLASFIYFGCALRLLILY